MARSRVTIRDFPAQAGISLQTASGVINNNDAARQQIRLREEAAIQALSHHPDTTARSMARGRSRYVACSSTNLTDYTFASIVDSGRSEGIMVVYLFTDDRHKHPASYAGG